MTKINKDDELLKDFEDLYAIDISDLYFERQHDAPNST